MGVLGLLQSDVPPPPSHSDPVVPSPSSQRPLAVLPSVIPLPSHVGGRVGDGETCLHLRLRDSSQPVPSAFDLPPTDFHAVKVPDDQFAKVTRAALRFREKRV